MNNLASWMDGVSKNSRQGDPETIKARKKYAFEAQLNTGSFLHSIWDDCQLALIHMATSKYGIQALARVSKIMAKWNDYWSTDYAEVHTLSKVDRGIIYSAGASAPQMLTLLLGYTYNSSGDLIITTQTLLERRPFYWKLLDLDMPIVTIPRRRYQVPQNPAPPVKNKQSDRDINALLIELAQVTKSPDLARQADVWERLHRTYYTYHYNDEAIRCAYQALNILLHMPAKKKQLGELAEILGAELMHQGYGNYATHAFTQAIFWYKQIPRADLANVDVKISSCMTSRGTCFMSLEQFQKAHDSLIEALPYIPKLPKLAQLGIYSNLGQCLGLLNRHEEAIATGRKALALAEQESEVGQTIACMQTLAGSLEYAKRWSELVELGNRCLALHSKHPRDPEGRARIYAHLAEAHFGLSQTEKCRYYASEGIKFIRMAFNGTHPVMLRLQELAKK